jgi:hypothetical protein
MVVLAVLKLEAGLDRAAMHLNVSTVARPLVATAVDRCEGSAAPDLRALLSLTGGAEQDVGARRWS